VAKFSEPQAKALVEILQAGGIGDNRIDMIHVLGELMEEPILKQKPAQRRTRSKADEGK
jgi:hypothetical protein